MQAKFAETFIGCFLYMSPNLHIAYAHFTKNWGKKCKKIRDKTLVTKEAILPVEVKEEIQDIRQLLLEAVVNKPLVESLP